ncbi:MULTISPECIES: RNA 3'-terminal phosphate cyclase [Nitrosomonas]|uniref:RNA 3'-terminal phosphate cyclase n=1 Tax=Nitrosomonas communis TaxID=44574 RepID=A0A0F7KC07_9PROT|nr:MULTISPECIES: RNA 3'-terminal phosphate cyclase [Nitrosomonas]AKH36668.1 ribosomal subunit interface protein [Nitrosomonas communis]TYP85826.1 RNA 3'-terminal phosphate cyclase (ATP) [Nitrosomonas communis]UVS61713.1 RNA 3'-terminal phosphate cyclase [Nitrosomonas sp. PLL12]
MLEIDGSYGEGGGQLLRLAVALSAITGIDVRIMNIRTRRDKPGLAAQHLAGVHAVGKLCGANIEGLALRSDQIVFGPATLQGGDYRFDVGTAGSITLVLQALLPVMLATQLPCKVHITGGTDVRQAPAADYLRAVLIPLIKRLGAQVTMCVLRRGYYPQGGGEIELAVKPAMLSSAVFEASGYSKTISGLAHVTNLPEHIALRMKQAVLNRLGTYGTHARIETQVLGREAAFGAGGAITCWLESEHTVRGAARVAEWGVTAETLGEAVGEELATDIAAGAALDIHAADQILVYLALLGGGSFSTRHISLHARTAMWLIEQFLPVTFEVTESSDLAYITVRLRRESS